MRGVGCYPGARNFGNFGNLGTFGNGQVMYTKILVAIENSAADRAVLHHIEQLSRLTGAGLLLVHVADGFAARHFEDLKLRESEEMRDDRAYLERLCEDMRGKGMVCAARLA